MNVDPRGDIGPLDGTPLGDETAVQDCVDRYGGLVWSIARRFSRNLEDAEDAVQTAYFSLIRKRGERLEAPVLPWLLRTELWRTRSRVAIWRCRIQPFWRSVCLVTATVMAMWT